MEDREAIKMMQWCREEILHLRRVNAELAPKAEAYDQMRKVLNLLPEKSQGLSVDIAWSLEKRIDELEAEQVATKPDQQAATKREPEEA